ncbi:MAG: nucleotidyltransferase family protein [Eubacteriales bacterium]|jgi:hypothetical protein
MNKPILVVMAAGLGSRYGGLKQIDPVGPHGQLIIDYAVYDAVRAGFTKVVFIIKEENHAVFEETIGARVRGAIDVEYVFQKIDDIPEGFSIPEGRVKPWGTAHAVWSARKVLDQPFAVINADDFYGFGAFKALYDFLAPVDPNSREFMLAGFRVENTLTEHGTVARGVCEVDSSGFLTGVTERTKIAKAPGGAKYTEDGVTWHDIPAGTVVSMNTWGFTTSLFDEMALVFPNFLKNDVPKNPLKAEFFLPFVVDEMIREKKAQVRVIDTGERWYGMTYREDRPVVVAAIEKMTAEGKYPENLWNR